jgi:NAD(P)H dehydrogenase (quinone)
MTILVTAASGHLGRLTVHALLERGTDPATVVATARDTSRIADLAELGVRTVRADYDDAASLEAAFAGVDTLLLVSGSEVGQRVPQHTRAVKAAAAAGVGRVVYTSAPHADTADYLLAQEHRATEAVLAASGLPTTVLRNGWYLENYTENAAPALATGQVFGAAGEGRISAAARRDFAEAAAVALLDDSLAGQALELGGDESFTMAEYAAALGEAAGREITYVDVPAEGYAASLAEHGVPTAMAEVLADTDQAISRGEMLEESGTLARLIGRPTTPLADAVRASVTASQA